MKSFLSLCTVILAYSISSAAATINVGTAGNATNWLLTAGSGAGPAFQAGPLIAISVDGKNNTTTIPGFDNSTWDGVWVGTLQFILPAGASGVSLTVTNPVVDDRWVLQLNGTNIADYARGVSGAGLF